MTRGLNSKADSKGGSTFAGAGSTPVGSTIHAVRAQARGIVLSMPPCQMLRLARRHEKPLTWVVRRLLHTAYFRPHALFEIANRKPERKRTDAEKIAQQYEITQQYQAHVNKNAKRQQRDGVVVTPIEVVDFQIRSALEQVRALGYEPDSGVEWLDPFGGTGAYTARLLQLVDLPRTRKRAMADNCVVIEIDPDAAQFAANNLAAVYEEETGSKGCVRVVCTDTFALNPMANLRDSALPVILPSGGVQP